MRLTTKGRYAVTALLDLALHESCGPVPLTEIASRQDLSLSYLEQLFRQLRRRGLVDSTRGPGGGYRLSRPAAEVAVADVIDAVDESVDATRCKGMENCQGDQRCITHDLWQDLSRQIHDFLSGITLAHLVERQNLPPPPNPHALGAPGNPGDSQDQLKTPAGKSLEVEINVA
jgi:Rrf2 family iron-sulfur cluster assembly transcriptional regulator